MTIEYQPQGVCSRVMRVRPLLLGSDGSSRSCAGGFGVVFISWTVNGLLVCMKKGVAGFYPENKPNLFCLQEAKTE